MRLRAVRRFTFLLLALTVLAVSFVAQAQEGDGGAIVPSTAGAPGAAAAAGDWRSSAVPARGGRVGPSASGVYFNENYNWRDYATPARGPGARAQGFQSDPRYGFVDPTGGGRDWRESADRVGAGGAGQGRYPWGTNSVFNFQYPYMPPYSAWPPSYDPRDPNLRWPNPDRMEISDCVFCQAPEGGEVRFQEDLRSVANRLSIPTATELESREIGRGAWGARRVTATIYQNCDAVRMDNLMPPTYRQPGLVPAGNGRTGPLINTPEIQAGRTLERNSPHRFFIPSEVAKSMYIRQEGPAEQCLDMRLTPPIFYIGQKARFTRMSDGRMSVDVMRPVRRPAGAPIQTDSAGAVANALATGGFRDMVGFDCTGFMCASLVAGGLRVRAGQDACAVGAAELSRMGGNPNDCFKPASFSGDSSIRSGDIFALPVPDEIYGHSMMIESVGRDPFGIAALGPGQCRPENVDYRRFDFTVIQSGTLLDRPAVSRMNANEMLHTSSQWVRDYFISAALKACEARTSGRAQSGRATSNGRVAWSFMRHESGKSGCVNPKGPASLGRPERCIESCEHLQNGAPSAGAGARE